MKARSNKLDHQRNSLNKIIKKRIHLRMIRDSYRQIRKILRSRRMMISIGTRSPIMEFIQSERIRRRAQTIRRVSITLRRGSISCREILTVGLTNLDWSSRKLKRQLEKLCPKELFPIPLSPQKMPLSRNPLSKQIHRIAWLHRMKIKKILKKRLNFSKKRLQSSTNRKKSQRNNPNKSSKSQKSMWKIHFPLQTKIKSNIPLNKRMSSLKK